MDKTALRDELVARVAEELEALERAHRAVMEAATHEEAKPENDKDTRALEQSYLARGQAMRVQSLREALASCRALTVAPLARAALGALLRVEDDGVARTLYLAPHGGGTALAASSVQVVTPTSPLGRALLGREAGDVCEAEVSGRVREVEVLEVS
ncbi:MAG: GreA/GreB family elongation factor [Polyangiales bacterium]